MTERSAAYDAIPAKSNPCTTRTGKQMSKDRFYVEQRPEGDYAVRKPNSGRASAVTPTQREAIEWVKERHPDAKPDVERVRYTDRGKPDQWRKS